MATDESEARRLALPEAEDVLQRAADQFADYGLTIGDPDGIAEPVAGWRVA